MLLAYSRAINPYKDTIKHSEYLLYKKPFHNNKFFYVLYRQKFYTTESGEKTERKAIAIFDNQDTAINIVDIDWIINEDIL